MKPVRQSGRKSWVATSSELPLLVAVVASLLFVGLQLKLSQGIAFAAKNQARADHDVGNTGDLLQSDPAMRVIGKRILEDIQFNELLDGSKPTVEHVDH